MVLYLYDMRYLPEEIRERFHSDMRIVAGYLAEGKDYQPTSQPVIHIQEFLLLMKEISGDTRYEQMITQLEEEQNTGGMTMCELLDKYENRGIEKGMKRGMEEGVKEGMKKGMKKGMKEGVKKGLLQGIKALVEICQDFGLTQTETSEKVLQKFSISQDESIKRTQMYWHA